MSRGYYLHQLSTAIKDVLPAKCHKDFDAWMQNGTLQLTPKDGGTGVELARLNYQAVFMVEDLPFRELDPAVVLATVAAWLQDHDTDRERLELPDPDYDVEPIDEHSADLTISVLFSEPLLMVPDAAGPIRYGGERYRLAPYEIWVAEYGKLWVNENGPWPLAGDA
ncbi:phage tail protein [Oceanimonas smirnovii]|uniref:phage tail protein n=1 Tax=Oceanimonas smirnovii TaxID=264574 RepID=UPI003AAD331F